MNKKITAKSKFENNTPVKRQIFKSIDEMYDSIPEEGSLGLLAYGARGLLAWRKKKEQNKKNNG